MSGKDAAGQDFFVGVYPLFVDESCYFLAMDFDKDAWRDDVLAVMETCRCLQIPATLARKLGSFVLTENPA